MRSCQPKLSKPRDGEVLLLHLNEQKHTWSAVLVQRAEILLHTPEVQRSLARKTEELVSIREPPCFRRVYPKTFRTTRPTKVLLPRSCPIDLEGTPNGSAEGNMCYLDNSPHPIDIESGPSPEDRVRCCIKSIKTLGWRLQTGCNIYRSSWVRALIPRTSRFPRINLQVQNDQNMKPLGASDSREESSGTTSSYKTYVDTSG
ncbi:hypothetical protein F2Q70_00011119 [Brassica cretica]|uniref:Uncharacterized protein n=1 Tax=Brassica cretica TaxID=69181 RepID=A0A8S9M5X8_BRACR|nr:hypothetical protein F2Q70_00011119 [Brassica cretica]